MAAEAFGHRVLAGPKSGGYHRRQLAGRSHSGAGLVRERGAEAVRLPGGERPAFPVALFAAARAGVPLVPLNFRLGQRQLDALLARHPKALGIADPDALAHFERAGIDAMTIDEWLAQTRVDRGEFSEAGVARREQARTRPLWSSTQAAPRRSPRACCYVTRPGLLRAWVGGVRFPPMSRKRALVSVPPYPHRRGRECDHQPSTRAAAPSCSRLFAPVSGFARCGRRRSPARWWCRRCWQGSSTAGRTSRFLRCGRSPTAALDAGRAHRAGIAGVGAVDFVNAYGLTETSSTVALLGPTDHRAALESPEPAVRARLSSVGRPLPGIEPRDPRPGW